MTLLGELRVQAVQDNLLPITYYLHGLASRLHLSESTLQGLELSVEAAMSHIMHHAYSRSEPGEALIRVETVGSGNDESLLITCTDWGLAVNLGVQTFAHVNPMSVDYKPAAQPGGPNVIKMRQNIERGSSSANVMSVDQELNAIQTISELMTTNIQLDELLKLIIDKLVDTIDADRGTLYLVDEEHGELVSKVLLEDTALLKEIRIKVGEGIAGHVAATGEVVNVHHAYEDPRFLQDFDRDTGYHTETILAAPLHNPQQKLIGVAQLLNKNGGAFTARDERLLVAMSSQAAISIENARLYAKEISQRLTTQELETARSIQRSFLPEVIPQQPGWDFAAMWQPAHNVSGDFYDVRALDPGRGAFVIGDVAGKGVPAALFMALTVTVLRFALALTFSPKELLERANRTILSFNEQSQMFASIFIGYLDYASGELCYASGGHNPPLLYHASTGKCEYIKAKGVIVGMLEDIQFAEESVTLQTGDVLVMYTDGITEAMTTLDEEFGLERLEAVITQFAAVPAREIAELLIASVNAFSGERGAFDDETLVVIKRS